MNDAKEFAELIQLIKCEVEKYKFSKVKLTDDELVDNVVGGSDGLCTPEGSAFIGKVVKTVLGLAIAVPTVAIVTGIATSAYKISKEMFSDD